MDPFAHYAAGTLPMRALAEALGLSVPETVEELERRGVHRSIEAIRLTDAERDAIDVRLHADRLARDGKPVFNPDLVEREVIASQRLAGIRVASSKSKRAADAAVDSTKEDQS